MHNSMSRDVYRRLLHPDTKLHTNQHALSLYESRRLETGDLVLRSQSLCHTDSHLCAAKYSGFHLRQSHSLPFQQVQQTRPALPMAVLDHLGLLHQASEYSYDNRH